MMHRSFYILIFGSISCVALLQGQSISEKKTSLTQSESAFDRDTAEFLLRVNKETSEIIAQIHNLYEKAFELYQVNAPQESYQAILEQIKQEKQKLVHLENSWREINIHNNINDGYGLWHAPETTLEQLIIDYGSQDYVYLIPPEVGSIKLSINSNLPIPRSSWNEILGLILTQNGVGIRELNPYLRQLYLVRENAHVRMITNRREDLILLPDEARVSFVLSPEPSEVRRSYAFLEKFVNPNTTSLHILGRDIFVIGPSGEIQDLLKLYDFTAAHRSNKEYRIIPLHKIDADGMAKILLAIFDQASAQTSDGENAGSGDIAVNGLRILPLGEQAQALFIVGSSEEVRQAEEMIANIECQMSGAREKVIFWYTVKHSDAEELADVLQRIYSLMISTNTGMEQVPGDQGILPNNVPPAALPPYANLSQKEPPDSLYGQEGFYQEGGYVVNPAPAEPRIFTKTIANEGRDNFIVDIKTGAIVMVVEADILPKLKDLTKKLDVPKKMVQLEVLLFEKMLHRENSFGLNLLRIGSAANHHQRSGAVFNTVFPHHGSHGGHEGSNHGVRGGAGIFEFLISRKASDCGIPAFDLAYRFLLSQDDVQINSNPSVTTTNQTPATISINEELSINTGVFEVDTAKGTALKDAFTRAQYGITISMKPTIHIANSKDDDEDYDYVSLENDVTFDTIQPGCGDDRPNVIRRHITNQVQVPDGQTAILGGLRRKNSHDKRESVPFLGELPGLGKLFSITTMSENNTDMFIFITPHIIKDPKEQMICLRQELLAIRPGDVPYFLKCVEEAHRYEKTRLMEGSMTMLFGRPREPYYIMDDDPTYSFCGEVDCGESSCGEYDGR